MQRFSLFSIFCLTTLLMGCAEHAPLGDSVARLKTEQTYDQQATANHQDYVPQASGERMQPAVLLYQRTAAPQTLSTQKQGDSIKVELAK
ncbi:hypothetical protein VST7929_01809 [Vibrio stylophorae]|uniref:Lipoprotein n=2 Tax=Vibrio stylophorae TaxID=659351 RepID=A0ABM8ZUF3_9VIBR|nr:hypothetical protein VST7929_01809 [Vibrio stylophorae]